MCGKSLSNGAFRMKLLSALNNPWLVVASLLSAFWWSIENKHLIPDEVEPQTVWEDEQKYGPLKDEVQALAADFVDRNIPWALQELDRIESGQSSRFSEEGIYNYLCGTVGREGQYPRYERIHGTKHFTDDGYCN